MTLVLPVSLGVPQVVTLTEPARLEAIFRDVLASVPFWGLRRGEYKPPPPLRGSLGFMGYAHLGLANSRQPQATRRCPFGAEKDVKDHKDTKDARCLGLW